MEFTVFYRAAVPKLIVKDSQESLITWTADDQLFPRSIKNKKDSKKNTVPANVVTDTKDIKSGVITHVSVNVSL